MKNGNNNICIITSIFPNFDSEEKLYGTTFLYKYAKEWVKKGNKVTIIHMSRSYPRIFDVIALCLSKIGIHRLEKYIIPKDIQNTNEYTYENIKIIRYQYKKIIPHAVISKRNAKKYANIITKKMRENNFLPDVIIGDFLDCALPIIKHLDKNFECKKMQIVHNSDYKYMKNRLINEMFPIVNTWLFRSKAQKVKMDKYISDYNYDYMYSGIEHDIVMHKEVNRKKIENLLYVGKLIKVKGLDTVLYALKDISNSKITLNVVGSGTDERYYKNLVKKLKLEKQVSFLGHIEHSKVFQYMRESDAMVLISHETFGMVYVEAMATGCIPIGALNEGIDGVVIDGCNGFLVPYGDVDELKNKILLLTSLPETKVSELSEKAYETAKKMTDQNLANHLLEIIKSK